MAWDGMSAFVRALDERGELVRIRKRVDVRHEIAAVADRVMKAGGPALLFEDPSGSRFPLLVNAFGSRRRMALALGVDDLEEHARAIESLVHPRAPASARELAQLALKLPELAHVPPRAASMLLATTSSAPATTSIWTRFLSSRAGPATGAPSSPFRRSSRATPRPGCATSAATACRSSTGAAPPCTGRSTRRAPATSVAPRSSGARASTSPSLSAAIPYSPTPPPPRSPTGSTNGCSQASCASAPSAPCAARPSISKSPPTPTSSSKATSIRAKTSSTRGRSAITPGTTRRSTSSRAFTSPRSRTATTRCFPPRWSGRRPWKTPGSAKLPSASFCRSFARCSPKSST